MITVFDSLYSGYLRIDIICENKSHLRFKAGGSFGQGIIMTVSGSCIFHIIKCGQTK